MTAQRADAVGGNDLWHYAVGSERKGPVPRTTIAKLLASGEISAETYVWQPGMDNWVHLGDAAALKSLVAGLGGDSGPEDFVEEDTAFTSSADLRAVHSQLDDGEELSGDTIVESISMAQAAAIAGPRVELAAAKPAAKVETKAEPAKKDSGLFSDVASSTSGAAAVAGADIFGSKDDALGEDIFGSGGPTAEEEQIAGVHSRRQSSVLFSLDELGREEGGGGGKRSGSEQFVTDSSGLIDIKAIATVDKRAGDDPFGASAPNLVIPIGGRPNIAPMTIPIVERRRGNGPWILAAAALLVIGGGILVFILTNNKDKPGPETVAQATTEPAKTEPVAKVEPAKTEPAKTEPVAKVEPKIEEAKVEPKLEADAGAKPPEADAIAAAPDAGKTEPAGNPVEAKVEKVEKVEKPKTEAEKAKAEADKLKAEKAKAEADKAKAEADKLKAEAKVEAKVESPPTKPNGDGAAKVNDLLSKLNGADKKDDKKDETADTSLPDKLSAAAVRAAIRGKFDRCGGMITNATGSVTVQTQFVISSSGVVQSARVTDGGGTSSDVQRCVVGVIQGTTFGKFKEATMQVNLPVKLL
jgi:hypothetical protein